MLITIKNIKKYKLIRINTILKNHLETTEVLITSLLVLTTVPTPENESRLDTIRAINRFIFLIFFGFSFGAKAETTIKTTKIPPINKRKITTLIQTSPVILTVDLSIRALSVITIIPILTGFLILTIRPAKTIVRISIIVIIFFSLTKISTLDVEDARKIHH